MNAQEFEKYTGKHTNGKKGEDYLSGGKIIGYDPKDAHPLQLLAIDDIHGDGGRVFEAVIPDKDDLKDWLCGKHKYIWVTVENVIMDELKEITESNKKTVMETRNVKVTLETAQRWYGQGGEFKEMALSAYAEDELNPVKNEWESKIIDYGTKFVSGWCLGSDSVYKETNEENTDKPTFRTEKQAVAAIAYAQLTHIMALTEYNGSWIPNWNDASEKKFCIICSKEKLRVDTFYEYRQKVCFKSIGLAERFLENNSDLLKQFNEMD